VAPFKKQHLFNDDAVVGTEMASEFDAHFLQNQDILF
jgi:hypothetical protein